MDARHRFLHQSQTAQTAPSRPHRTVLVAQADLEPSGHEVPPARFPSKLGPAQLMKYSVRPHEKRPVQRVLGIWLRALTYLVVSNFGGMKKSHNMLREALIDRLHHADASFDFCVQVRDIPVDASKKDRIENDAVASWDERDFPPTKVAEIRVLRLEDDFDADVMMAFGQHLSFTPSSTTFRITSRSEVSTRRARSRVRAHLDSTSRAQPQAAPRAAGQRVRRGIPRFARR